MEDAAIYGLLYYTTGSFAEMSEKPKVTTLLKSNYSPLTSICEFRQVNCDIFSKLNVNGQTFSCIYL